MLKACLRTHRLYTYTACLPSVSVYGVHAEVSVYVLRMWWKCQCLSVSVEVSVFKGFSGRTLRNAFGKKRGGQEVVNMSAFWGVVMQVM